MCFASDEMGELGRSVVNKWRALLNFAIFHNDDVDFLDVH